MLEPLRTIPGPDFLLYFLAAMAITFIVVRSLAYNDGSLDHMPPQFTRLDPYSIAALRGGAPEAVKVALYDLERQGLVKLEGKGAEMTMQPTGSAQDAHPPIARHTLDQISQTSAPRDLFANSVFMGSVEGLLAPQYEEMRRRHLARDDDQGYQAWRAYLAGVALLGTAGVAKAYLGVIHNKPIGFLVVLLLAAPIILLFAARPTGRPTALGKRHLADLQTHFGWVKAAMKKGKSIEAPNAAFALAVFGAGVLGEGALYDLFNKAAMPQSSSSGGCSGGGGSCGGGGCGGGGCGGCG
jgi:uncharacterized protein (TIGR04222 family)